MVESVQILHGHCPDGGIALALMKVKLCVWAVWPHWSCTPLTLTVKVVAAGSWFAGVNVATVSALFIDTEPGTVPDESVTVNVSVLGTTGLLNVTVGVVVTGLLDEPG